MTANAAAAAIGIEGVARRFPGGQGAALDGVSLQTRPGELMALLGPSGSGKTTLLRAIAGLETVDAGRILLDGEDATRIPARRRRVGFVFQNYALFRHMTVFENVAFGLRARPRRDRPAEAEIRERVLRLLETVQLGGYEKRRPAALSGGQRQRVALARALMNRPALLLADEPTGALDAQAGRELGDMLGDLNRRGQTLLLVTHDPEVARRCATRIVRLADGRISPAGFQAPAVPGTGVTGGRPARLGISVGRRAHEPEEPLPDQGLVVDAPHEGRR